MMTEVKHFLVQRSDKNGRSFQLPSFTNRVATEAPAMPSFVNITTEQMTYLFQIPLQEQKQST